jgi:hypothetical protein
MVDAEVASENEHAEAALAKALKRRSAAVALGLLAAGTDQLLRRVESGNRNPNVFVSERA